MILMANCLELFEKKKFKELITYIERPDFEIGKFVPKLDPQLHRMRGRLLNHVEELRSGVAKLGDVEEQENRAVRDTFIALLVSYMDLQLRVVSHAAKNVFVLHDRLKESERLLKQLATENRLADARQTRKEKNKRRDARIVDIAINSGLPSVNKQADHIHNIWDDDDDLGDFNRLSADRIRKILAH